MKSKIIIVIGVIIFLLILNSFISRVDRRNENRLREMEKIEKTVMEFQEREGYWPGGINQLLQRVCNKKITDDCIDVGIKVKGEYWIASSFDNTQIGLVASDWEKKCPSGYILVPGNSLYDTEAFCVMQYEARTEDGLPWVNVSRNQARQICKDQGGSLMNNSQWMTIARGIEVVNENWVDQKIKQGNVDGQELLGGSSKDRALTLINGEIIYDFIGNAWHWLDDVITNQPLANTIKEPLWDWSDFSNVKRLGERYRYIIGFFDNDDWRKDDINPSMSIWDRDYGMGRIYHYSSLDSPGERALLRGGDWFSAKESGLYSALFNMLPEDSSSSFGFRCVR
jgi:hypothetical protein